MKKVVSKVLIFMLLGSLAGCSSNNSQASKDNNTKESGENVQSEEMTTEEVDETQYVQIGDTITFGKYEQDNDTSNGKEDIEWTVLHKDQGKMFVISKYGLDTMTMRDNYDFDNDMYVYWHNSTLRSWLNDDFYKDAFTQEEQEQIITTDVIADWQDNIEEREKQYNTQDKVFLLSKKDVSRYIPEEEERLCQPTEYAKSKEAEINEENGMTWWWLRSSPSLLTYTGYVLDDVGSGGENTHTADFDTKGVVRPVMWINGSDKYPVEQNVKIKPSDARVGDTVKLGKYEQDNNTSNGKEDIEWIVIEKTDDKIFVLSKYIIDAKAYHNEFEDITWENSDIRSWLNDEFYNSVFTDKEKDLIELSQLTPGYYKDMEVEQGEDTTDKVFLLSKEELDEYYSSDEERKAVATAYTESNGVTNQEGDNAGWWWLRTSGGLTNLQALRVRNDGFVSGEGVSYAGGVRPAMWIRR